MVGGSTGASEGVMSSSAPAKASQVKAPEPEQAPLGGITGPWADDGSSTMAQQAKVVEEEDAQTTPGGLY